MIIPGFCLASWFGWIAGILIFRLPWGDPKFTLKSLPTFFNVIFAIVFVFFNVDIIYHFRGVMQGYYEAGGQSFGRVETIVVCFEYAELLISNCVMRSVFLWKGKKLADFLGRLRRYNITQMRRRSPATWRDCLVTSLVFASTLGFCTLMGVTQYFVEGSKYWTRDWLGPLGQTLLFTILFLIPVMIPMQVSFSFIVATCGYLSTIFQDYCQHVLDIVGENKWAGMSLLAGSHQPEKPTGRVFFTDKTRREMLARFSIVQEVFDLAQDLIGPLSLILLAGSSIAVVMIAYEVMAFTVSPLMLAKNGCHMVNYICYFWVLQCGQRILDKVNLSSTGYMKCLLIHLIVFVGMYNIFLNG